MGEDVCLWTSRVLLFCPVEELQVGDLYKGSLPGTYIPFRYPAEGCVDPTPTESEGPPDGSLRLTSHDRALSCFCPHRIRRQIKVYGFRCHVCLEEGSSSQNWSEKMHQIIGDTEQWLEMVPEVSWRFEDWLFGANERPEHKIGNPTSGHPFGPVVGEASSLPEMHAVGLMMESSSSSTTRR
ncbi:hypothetical protein MJG53_016018 [Ovis ammon polii x Ovis aries]|uniref:Uncharacterized protein n=1 Tax=Ovis ammon polii x Ovis aries TaxID=2918886 RepID=A0ACB9UD05_9CETA|nr:hypothetical protein MJG53_016018 [Ovis ammon polii x Ovis aries]